MQARKKCEQEYKDYYCIETQKTSQIFKERFTGVKESKLKGMLENITWTGFERFYLIYRCITIIPLKINHAHTMDVIRIVANC